LKTVIFVKMVKIGKSEGEAVEFFTIVVQM